MSNKHLGSSFDTFLEEEGFYSAVKTVAIKRVLAYPLQEWMDNSGTSKARAATVVGKKLDIKLE